jgi:MFS family permease
LAAAAEAPAVLIAGRALQGVASAFASASALSIITVTYSRGQERDRALAAWSVTSGFSASLGLLLGGVVTQVLDWPWVFGLLLPASAVATIGTLVIVPTYAGTGTSGSLDVLGALLGTLTVIAFTAGISDSATFGWGSPETILPLIATIPCAIAFVARERRAAEPLLPLRVFRLRNLVGGNIATVVFGAVLLGMFALSSIYLQDGRGYTPVEAGLAMLAMGATSLILSMLVPWVLVRVGLRLVLAVSLATLGAGCVALGLVGHNGSLWLAFIPAALLFGVGISGCEVSGMIASTEDLGHGPLAGLASGLWNSSLQIGGAVGLAVLATAMASAPSLGTTGVADGYRKAALIATGFALVGAFVTAVIVRDRSTQAPIVETLV